LSQSVDFLYECAKMDLTSSKNYLLTFILNFEYYELNIRKFHNYENEIYVYKINIERNI